MKGLYVSNTNVGTVATLMTFSVFAMSVLVVLMLGVSTYKKISETSREGYDDRICLSYIWTKVKNVDNAANIYVGDFMGLSALFINETEGGANFHTMIYFYDGWVRELFFEEGPTFNPQDGMRISGASSLDFEQLDNGIIKSTVGSEFVYISPRGSIDTPYPKRGQAFG